MTISASIEPNTDSTLQAVFHRIELGFLTRGHRLKPIVYTRGDSMNGTPTVSWQRLCAIDRVKLKVTKSSVKS